MKNHHHDSNHVMTKILQKKKKCDGPQLHVTSSTVHETTQRPAADQWLCKISSNSAAPGLLKETVIYI